MTTPTAIPSYEQIVKTIQFDEIVKQVQDLPSLPVVVMDLLRSIDEEDADIGALAEKVTLDQALAAKTLRFANSSLYGSPAKVTTIQQAITRLGVATVRNLITAAAMTGSFPKGAITFFNFTAFWRHAIGTAICANVIARHVRADADYAFTAGLLHDIGRLVLVTRFPQHYERALAYRAEHDCPMLVAERAVLDVDHAMAGHALACHWHFSEVLQHAIAAHHDPDSAPSDTLTAIVHVADAIAHALDLSAQEDDLVPPVSDAAWKLLGMNDKLCRQVFDDTLQQFEGINRLLA